MSAEQWQLSLRQLYGTADALEAGVSAPAPRPAPAPAPAPAPVVVTSEPDVAPANRSTTRLLVSSAVHSALTVGVLLAGFALADPILPRPERPHLAGPEMAVDELSSADGAIPQSGANQP